MEGSSMEWLQARLINLQEDLGLESNVAKLARYLNLSTRTYQHILAGRGINLSTLDAIAAGMCLEPYELIRPISNLGYAGQLVHDGSGVEALHWLAENLNTEQRRLGLTDKQMAQRLGMKPFLLSGVRSGNGIRLATLEVISAALGVAPWRLIAPQMGKPKGVIIWRRDPQRRAANG